MSKMSSKTGHYVTRYYDGISHDSSYEIDRIFTVLSGFWSRNVNTIWHRVDSTRRCAKQSCATFDLKQLIENLRLATTLAKDNVKHNIERNRKAYDATAKDPNFKIGQTVLLYPPHVQKGMSFKLPKNTKVRITLWSVAKTTHSLSHANTHVWMKTVVHANRLNPFNEDVNAQRKETVDEGDNSKKQTPWKIGQTNKQTNKLIQMPTIT